MKEQLIKAMQHNQLVDLVYISQDGKITKRRIKLIKIIGDKFQAFCFTKHARRTFITDNVLAVMPVLRKERVVI
ncbi:transcriptional regulator [Rummeliibacillus stabekisii]|uniref:transcriptional regulator n=1 Tax=Rummeliibacillus stabekisii TaxID=241244 RepID=UPI00371BA61B